MARIGGYLTNLEHEAFKRYSASLLLKDSALAGLLIARELRTQRLEGLRRYFQPGAPVEVRRRVTAPEMPDDTRIAFGERARSSGLTVDQAASILFRAELVERWLERGIVESN